MSNNNDGAASLMGLFQPPPPSQQQDEDKDRRDSEMAIASVVTTDSERTTVVTNVAATSQLMGLFQPPDEGKPTATNQGTSTTETTGMVANGNDGATKGKPAVNSPTKLMSLFAPPEETESPTKTPLSTNTGSRTQHVSDLFYKEEEVPIFPPLSKAELQQQKSNSERKPLLVRDEPTDLTPQASNSSSKRQYDSIPPAPRHKRMESILEDGILPDKPSQAEQLRDWWSKFATEHLTSSTFLGGFVFVLYHIVFSLAMSSTVSAGHKNLLGATTKMTTTGILLVSPLFIHTLGSEIPSQYPCVDLFLAPFMAKLAMTVHQTLEADPDCDSGDLDVFLATFTLLSGIGMMGSAILIFLATHFKLANLGSYLPFPVLCGFFSSVGVLLWTLAFSVDTGGKTLGQVIMGGSEEWLHAVTHHTPSLIAGIIMKMYGPTNPFFGTYVIFASIGVVYIIMFFTNTSMAEAQEGGWFWTPEDLMPPPMEGKWLPPNPFGIFFAFDLVHWGAIYNGLETTMALSFLYLLRCSLHATAMKKNVTNMQRREAVKPPPRKSSKPAILTHRRRFTEEVDIEALEKKNEAGFVMVSAKNPTIPLQKVLIKYSYGQWLAAACGSFGVTPSIAVMCTMYELGAEKKAPQYASLIFLAIFYVTNFQLVAYIPKVSFSGLIVLASLDMLGTWFVKSYYKTKEKAEWFVAPVIVVCGLVVGLLGAVFLGIAVSTFIFVAAFFRSGVVKYLSNGLTMRSTIERTSDAAQWLDQNGDKIQVVVLQNYLFFGNASSMLSYITSMFEEYPESEEPLDYDLPPLPKYILLDLTLVTGMDTSTVDVFNDVKTICKNNGAKLFVAGLSVNLRSTLALGKFKPELGQRNKRSVRFFADLDTAMGKAEDSLLLDEMIGCDGIYQDFPDDKDDAASFQRALQAIDAENGTDIASELVGLFEHTSPVTIEAGQHLYAFQGGPVNDYDRGLFFISNGMIKIESDNMTTMSRTRGPTDSFGSGQSAWGNRSLGSMQARYGTLGKQGALLKSGGGATNRESAIRLARIGPGWILGTLEGVGAAHFGRNQVAVTKCKLHHLPFRKIDTLQEENPKLVLGLYKVMSHLMARRQEITIGQLVTMHAIMTSPAPGKPTGRRGGTR